MTRKVYLIDNEDSKNGAIEVRDAETDEILYIHSYRHEGVLIWDIEDSWRKLRASHLTADYYKEVFKCQKCKSLIEIPENIEARVDNVNKIEYDLKCKCGNVITIECDTLRIKEI